MTCQEATESLDVRNGLPVDTCGHEAPWWCTKDREPKCVAHSHTEKCCRPLARDGA